MMKNMLQVPYISLINKNTTPEMASSVLNTFYKEQIAIAPWNKFSYKPEASFTMAYGTDCIFLKFYIREADIKANFCRSNTPVHLDSCVEFFIAFDGEKNYYNLEFNCTGTCYAAYGDEKTKREELKETWIDLIKCQSLIKKESLPGSTFYWELTTIIPLETFGFHSLTSLANKSCKVNFYKCGDSLPMPHYLCWNEIQSSSPNFHLPEFFGNAHFSISAQQ